MPSRPSRLARDRLDVWTYFEDGEEIPLGDLSVTDAERAAAGRETLAERWQALLPLNRRRAAERYSARGLPDGQAMVRVWRPRDPATLRARLAGAPLAAWPEDDVLHVLWRGTAEEVRLGGGIQPRLWPVEGASDLWEASLRIRRLDEAVISIVVIPRPAGGDGPEHPSQPGQTPDMLEWRGPRAPADPPAAWPLSGTMEEHTLDSTALGASRGLTVYRPPGASGPLPGCVLADGQSAWGFARVLEPAILAGDVQPVLLVGVHSAAADPARPWPDRRSQEYIPRDGRRRFTAHLDFITGEVIPWAEGHAGAAGGPWVAAGFSNGGAWAIAAAQRRPDIFPAVAAFSTGVVPGRLTRGSRTARVRHYLAAGLLETGFRDATERWAQRLQRAGLPCRYREWVGGHDQLWWDRQLPAALAWLLARQADVAGL
jgi:enterochelin esterase-like enzyme